MLFRAFVSQETEPAAIRQGGSLCISHTCLYHRSTVSTGYFDKMYTILQLNFVAMNTSVKQMLFFLPLFYPA